jgi:hypothetical protein
MEAFFVDWQLDCDVWQLTMYVATHALGRDGRIVFAVCPHDCQGPKHL